MVCNAEKSNNNNENGFDYLRIDNVLLFDIFFFLVNTLVRTHTRTHIGT